VGDAEDVLGGNVMNNPIPDPVQPTRNQPWIEHDCSGSNLLFAVGVVLLCFGAAITGRHETTMIGLGLIVFSRLCDL
jgi:hypothetical protein